MRTLAIECATEACSVALFDDKTLLAADHRVLGRGHAEQLVPMIAALPERGRADRILVSRGPGSFTGVRIGLATARALAIAWSAQVVGYPTLALVAAIARYRHGDQPVTVCMSGGHGEWFVQDFGSDGRPLDTLLSLTPGQAAQRPHQALIAGSQAPALAAATGMRQLVSDLLPEAAFASLMPAALLTAELMPLYGRPPDARMPG